MAADSRFTAVVNRLACLRGVATLTAFALAAEIDDWHRLSGATSGPIWGWCPASIPAEAAGLSWG
jgi:transposase